MLNRNRRFTKPAALGVALGVFGALAIVPVGTALADHSQVTGIRISPLKDFAKPGQCNKFTATVRGNDGTRGEGELVAIDIKQSDDGTVQDLVVGFCDPDGAGAGTDAGLASDLDDNLFPDDGLLPAPMPVDQGTERPANADGTCTTGAEGTCIFGVTSNEVGRMTVNVTTEDPTNPTVPFLAQAIKRWVTDLPACSDGRDNDGDGKTDGNDPGCAGPGDDSETGGSVLRTGPCKGFNIDSRTRRAGGGRVVVGTKGSDVLNGTKGQDIICGLGGRDNIKAMGSGDIAVGNGGEDTINGGGGGDDLQGNGAKDTLAGNRGKDRIRGGKGADIGDGGNNNDLMTGAAGGDSLRGNKGLDTIRGQGGGDTLQGGKGRDTVLGGKKGDVLYGSAGRDLLDGQAGKDFCRGGPGRDRVKRCER